MAPPGAAVAVVGLAEPEEPEAVPLGACWAKADWADLDWEVVEDKAGVEMAAVAVDTGEQATEVSAVAAEVA